MAAICDSKSIRIKGLNCAILDCTLSQIQDTLKFEACMGYGIFIENMLEAAQQNTIPKAT